jgi:hypothetical protein
MTINLRVRIDITTSESLRPSSMNDLIDRRAAQGRSPLDARLKVMRRLVGAAECPAVHENEFDPAV